MGGDFEHVYKVWEKEIALGHEYGLRNNYSKMVVYPLAGDKFRGDLSSFERLGITVDYSRNVTFIQVPVVGSDEFVKEWVKQKMNIISKTLDGVKGLSKRQVAVYLLRKARHGYRVIYYLRTTPRELIPGFVAEFDGELRDALQCVLGLVLDDQQWEQASFAVKQSGLGLTRAGDVADAA